MPRNVRKWWQCGIQPHHILTLFWEVIWNKKHIFFKKCFFYHVKNLGKHNQIIMHILISTKITRDRWKRELKHRCLLQHLNLLQQRDKQHYYILFWDSFFGLVNYPRAFSSQSSELAFDSCRDESKLYIQNKYSVCTNLSSLPVCFQWPEQLKQARFWSLFMTLMRIQICSNTFTSKVCEVWEMHFTSCKMGITTFSSPRYSFDEIINWREFIVQFRLPLQL